MSRDDQPARPSPAAAPPTAAMIKRSANPRPRLSIVCPCFNEEDAVALFVAAMDETLNGADFAATLIFVDDGSRDATRAALGALARARDDVRVVALSRNFGKEAAITAGLDHADGDAVVVMDVDLQDPPHLIHQFMAKWREGYDVVYAARADRSEDGFFKRWTAGKFYALFNRIAAAPIPADAGDYRLMDARVVAALRALPERSRFMKGLFAWVGYSTAKVSYERPARAAGETKFNYWKLWNFALDGITSFSTAPLRIWTYFGLAVAAASFLYASVVIGLTIMTGRDAPGYASLLVFILFFGSVQMISVGVLGEYIARLFNEVKQRPIYLVDETRGFAEGEMSVSGWVGSPEVTAHSRESETPPRALEG